MAAQDSGTLQATPVEVERDADPQIQRFKLNNKVNCSRLRYTLRLTPDPDKEFVSLPTRDFDLGNPDFVWVDVRYDPTGLEPGTYKANITIACKYCGQCRVRDKFVQVTMTVIEPVPDGADSPVSEAIEQPNESEPPTEEEGAESAGSDPVADPILDDSDSWVTETTPPDDPESQPLIASPEGEGTDSGTGSTDDATGQRGSGGNAGSGGIELLSGQGGGETEDSDPVNGGNTSLSDPKDSDENGDSNDRLKRVWLPIVVLLVVLGFVILYWRRSRATPAAKIDVRSHVDPGTQRVWPDISERPKPVLRVRLRSDAGEQSVHGDPTSMSKKE